MKKYSQLNIKYITTAKEGFVNITAFKKRFLRHPIITRGI